MSSTNPKPDFLSKTWWLGLLMAAIGGVLAYLQANAPALPDLVPAVESLPSSLWADGVESPEAGNVLVEMTAEDLQQVRSLVRAVHDDAEQPKDLNPATWCLIIGGILQVLLRYWTRDPVAPFWNVFSGGGGGPP